MGKASITIAVSSVFNGNGFDKAIDSATRLGSKLSRMEKITAQSATSISSDVARIGAKWEQVGAKMEQTGKKMADLGDNLTRSVTLPMVSAGAYAGKMAVDFDTALANVRKVSDMTGAELERLAQSALEMSKTQPVDAETILNVEALGSQLGIANENLESFAKTVTGLDIATNMDAETAATEMARFANIVGMADEEFGNYGSTLVAIGNNMATTESEVSQMAMRFASAGAQAGLSEAQILGMSAAMSSLGIKAEMGGSALSQVFVAISKAVSKGGDDVEAFAARAGMSAEEFRSAWQDDAAGAFNALIEGIGRASASGEDMNLIMAELGFTQIRNSDVMRRLAGSTEAVTGKQSVLASALKLSTDAWEQNTALQAEVDQRNESMASRLQVLKNKLDDIAITVGRPLVDALIGALESLDPLISSVADAARAFAEMDEVGQRNILMWAGVAAAAGPVLSITGRMVQGAGHLVRAFGETAQKVAVFTDAMNGLDGANLRTYASSKSSASALGLARNAAVKAAGGVDEYVKAWDKMVVASGSAKKAEEAINRLMAECGGTLDKATTSQLRRASALETDFNKAEAAYKANAKLVTAFSDSTQEAEKAAKGVKSLAPALEEVKSGASGSAKVLAEYRSGLKEAETASGSLTSTVKQGVTGAFGLAGASIKQFVTAAAPIAGVTLVVGTLTAAVAECVANYQRAEEHARLVADATVSASQIMADAGAAYRQVGDAIRSIEPNVQDTLESLRDLNCEASSTLSELGANAGMVDSYVSTMERLMNQTGLNAVEQERLKIAVEGYNSITGDAISVTDAANGKLSDQSGKLIDNSRQIRDSAAAWRERAEAEAYAQLATQYLKEQIEAENELAKAQANVDDLQRQVNEAYEESMRLFESGDVFGGAAASKRHQELQGQLARTKEGLEDLEAAAQSAGDTYDAFTVQAAIRSSDLAQSVKDDIASQEACYQEFALAVATHLQSSGRSVGAFEDNLASLGANTDKMRQMGSDNFQRLWSECDGDVSAMVAKINEFNGTPLNDKSAEVEATGNIPSGYAAQSVSDTRERIKELRDKKVYVDAYGNYSWAKGEISGLGSAIGGLASKAVDIIANVTKKHAEGGVIMHARGGIATRATNVTQHIAGEAGAEALVPLTNRHYVQPFAQVVAQETVAAMRVAGGSPSGGTTYVLNINGATLRSASPRAEEAIAAIFDEFNLTNRMGVV